MWPTILGELTAAATIPNASIAPTLVQRGRKCVCLSPCSPYASLRAPDRFTDAATRCLRLGCPPPNSRHGAKTPCASLWAQRPGSAHKFSTGRDVHPLWLPIWRKKGELWDGRPGLWPTILGELTAAATIPNASIAPTLVQRGRKCVCLSPCSPHATLRAPHRFTATATRVCDWDVHRRIPATSCASAPSNPPRLLLSCSPRRDSHAISVTRTAPRSLPTLPVRCAAGRHMTSAPGEQRAHQRGAH